MIWRPGFTTPGHSSWFLPVLGLILELAALPALAQTPGTPGEEYQGPSTEFQAPDHSFVCRVPQGWGSDVVLTNGQPLLHLLPETGNDRDLKVFWSVTAGGTIEELAQGEISTLRQSGVELLEEPRFLQVDGVPAVELLFRATLRDGSDARLWVAGALKGRFLFLVEGQALAPAAPALQQHARFLFHSMRLGEVPENRPFAAAIAGRWSYKQTTLNSVEVQQWLFDPSGRCQYLRQYHYYDSDTGAGIDRDETKTGTFTIYGSQMLVIADEGGAGVLNLEPVDAQGLRIDGTLFRRD